MIVTLDECKLHLRVQTDEEDDLLSSLLMQAEQSADDYCGVVWGNEETVPEPVRLAVLLMTAHFYEYRDSSDKNAYETMMNAFHTLLYPNRKPEVLF